MSLIYSNIPELEGTDTEITLANLSRLEEELERLFEKRIAHLSELARAIIKDGGDVDLVKSIILSIRSDGEIESDRVCHDNQGDLKKIFSQISLVERLTIFKELLAEKSLQIIQNEEREISEEAHNKIAYMKNSYNDAAFVRFAELLANPKAYYLENAVDVCESVINGKCQYCILPIETMRDGRLISFYESIINYDLSICAEYDLRTSEGTEYTRYALLSDSLTTIKKLKGNSFIEITYSDDNISLNEILTAAEFFGLRIDGIDSFVLNGISEKKHYCLTFSTSDADVESFMTYLNIDCPDVHLIGLYQRI